MTFQRFKPPGQNPEVFYKTSPMNGGLSKLEHKINVFHTRSRNPRSAAPITDMVGAACGDGGHLQEVSEVLHAARAEGRMIEPLALETIDVGYLVRDRIVSLDEDMQVLKDTLDLRAPTRCTLKMLG